VRARIAFLAAALVLAVAAPQAMGGSFHGVVAQGKLGVKDYKRMGSGKAGTLRLRVPWARLEPQPGQLEWTWLDRIVARAGAEGVRVLPALHGPGPAGIATPPTRPRARRAFAELAGAVAERYGPNGTVPGGGRPIAGLQIWNEQNGRTYWGAKPNPRKYAKLVKAAARRIRQADRRVEVILGGMFGTPSGRGAIRSWGYLKRLYAVRGVKRSFDTVAVHPYSPDLFGVKFQVRAIRKVMRNKGDGSARIRITEFGWGSKGGSNPLNKGRRGQARMLRKAFRLFERRRGGWRLSGANWFAWKNSPRGGCAFCPSAGLFTREGGPKPSWNAFKRVAR
jgi:Beta-galactosidase